MCYTIDYGIKWFEWVSKQRAMAFLFLIGCETWHVVWKAWEKRVSCFKSRFHSSCHFCQGVTWHRGNDFSSLFSFTYWLVMCRIASWIRSLGEILLTFSFPSFSLQVEMSGCKGPIMTFTVEPFIPYNEEFYLNIVLDRLGYSVSFSKCDDLKLNRTFTIKYRENQSKYIFNWKHSYTFSKTYLY